MEDAPERGLYVFDEVEVGWSCDHRCCKITDERGFNGSEVAGIPIGVAVTESLGWSFPMAHVVCPAESVPRKLAVTCPGCASGINKDTTAALAASTIDILVNVTLSE